MTKGRWCLGLLLLLAAQQLLAEPLRIAVASNFRAPLATLLAAGDIDARVSAAASGVLYAQITHGAPYDVFLSADEMRPAALEASGHAITGTRATYALGRLVLWMPGSNASAEALQTYRGRLAIANPRTAPYGRAAREVLDTLSLPAAVQLITATNISQAHQFVATGNAGAGFTALSLGPTPGAESWQVPADTHRPIAQQLVLLQDSKPARAFMDFIQSPAARSLIRQAGYDLPGVTND